MILVNGRQVTINTFPNGERMIKLPDTTLSLKNDKHVIVWQYENDGDFMLLNMVSEYITRNDLKNRKVECLIMSMPYERMDRSEEGSVCSLHNAVKLLPTNWDYNTIAPHSGEVEYYFRQEDLYLNSYSPLLDVIDYARNTLLNAANGFKTALIFPDKGAYERYGSDVLYNLRVPLYEVGYGNKVRDFETQEITKLEILDQEGNKMKSLQGFNVVVVDDLSSYGGTFVKIHELLKDMKINKSFLLLEKTEDSLLKGDLIGRYDKIFATDLMMKVVSDPTFVPELEIISSKEILRKITQRLSGGF